LKGFWGRIRFSVFSHSTVWISPFSAARAKSRRRGCKNAFVRLEFVSGWWSWGWHVFEPRQASVQEQKDHPEAVGVEVLRVTLPEPFERSHKTGATETVEIVGRAPVLWSKCKCR
jgi:hypothetical protein